MKFLAFSFLLFFPFAITLALALNSEETSVKTKKINKHAVLTIKGSYGDLIDCIDKREQPALRGHKIQRMRKQLSKVEKEQSEGRINKASQIWSGNETICPKGTVPIRRITSANTTTTENSTSNFEGKQHSFYRQLRFTGEHAFAVAIYDAPEGIYGGAAILNLWKPSVEMGARGREYSSAQIRIKAENANNEFDVIEAGWHVFPWYYTAEDDDVEDDKARFFISWTNDSYSRACYNMDCDGFVMQSNDVEFGSAFELTSTYDGEQEDISVAIWKDSQSRRWWLKYNDIVVGYWPEELFTHLRTRGTRVDWGGEVFNTKQNNRFTSTEMGSGHLANQGYGKASYFKHLGVETSGTGHHWISPHSVRGFVSDPNYYTIQPHADIDGLGNGGFFFGGPGNRNPS
ncbi:uncharacterized protein LOC120009955 [Tripterygium wilfordii]|uniref:uncharacterized protein LOC120009955 n=1 Tax=Tripterygium wilfordii TaxID=458696 RepID=UPI0018F8234F|nr:uncharacterized protein LOC120009955 [Tripterygium wilfordii]